VRGSLTHVQRLGIKPPLLLQVVWKLCRPDCSARVLLPDHALTFILASTEKIWKNEKCDNYPPSPLLWTVIMVVKPKHVRSLKTFSEKCTAVLLSRNDRFCQFCCVLCSKIICCTIKLEKLWKNCTDSTQGKKCLEKSVGLYSAYIQLLILPGHVSEERKNESYCLNKTNLNLSTPYFFIWKKLHVSAVKGSQYQATPKPSGRKIYNMYFMPWAKSRPYKNT
jgi:hypothetical protein